MTDTSKPLVLVTGGSGFVGVHCIIALINATGYRIRTTVRSLSRADSVRQMLKEGSAEQSGIDAVEFCAADLVKDDGWSDAVKDCTYVLHVASPFPPAAPKHEDDLIVPAREGTLRVLRAAKAAGGIKRIIVTSSVAAIGYGLGDEVTLFTEKNWSNLKDPRVPAYQKSKTLAEKAAWDYMEKEGGDMELAVVNPVGILGPVLGKPYATSVEIIVRLLNGALPGLPNIMFGVVDVRDVADLHLRAMTDPKAKGERFIALAGDFMTIQEMAFTLKARLGAQAKAVPTRMLPDVLLKVVGVFDKAVKLIVPELSKKINASSEKAKTELGWQPRSREDAIVATAESLLKLGIVKTK